VPSLRWPDESVVLSDVSVRYDLPSERVTSLKEVVVRRLTGRSVKYSQFWALRHIDLRVHRGEAIGLIGRNGAGKSTLLKVIARVQKPSSGRVLVRGHVSPLIELGAGFHPELTGRENIFVNGAMLGFSRKQMEKKFDRIVEFSGLEEFIDAPLRTYSSGMSARLGFAVAADADPDILIIDEALSVGDEAFQKKCIARMNEFREQGVTIFFVTHGLDSLAKLCPKSVWIDAGHLRKVGPTQEIIDAFRQSQTNDVSIIETRKMQVVHVERATGKQRAATGKPSTASDRHGALDDRR
jgi:ABC-2 type transport system ATP-binding protein/lipopolysaccharide transport system ATP-binding protein